MCTPGFDKIARFNPDFALARKIGGEKAMNTVADPLGWKGMQERTDARADAATAEAARQKQAAFMKQQYAAMQKYQQPGAKTILGG